MTNRLTPPEAVAGKIPVLVTEDETYKFIVPWHWMMAVGDGKISGEGFAVAMLYQPTVNVYEKYPTVDDLLATAQGEITRDRVEKGLIDLMVAGACRWFEWTPGTVQYIVYVDRVPGLDVGQRT